MKYPKKWLDIVEYLPDGESVLDRLREVGALKEPPKPTEFQLYREPPEWAKRKLANAYMRRASDNLEKFLKEDKERRYKERKIRMNIDEMTMGEFKELNNLFNSEQKTKKDYGWQICILQRGWVMVGHLTQEGTQMVLNNASVIRNWGTTKGLGEIAENGPTESTKLDKCPQVKFHELTLIGMLQCNESKWT